MVISVDDANRQFAFVKGNRPTNSKVVKAKERSIKAYGQLSPVTVVNGEKVTAMGGCLVDQQGNEIPNDEAVKYYAVLDGQHRLIAYQNLGMNMDDLVICEPLNAELSIANEYLHNDVERGGLYGRSCHDAGKIERGIRFCHAVA